jgi:hypothetical protein
MQSRDEIETQAILEAAYGTEYSQQRIDILFDLCRERGWSGKRLQDTAKHIISTKPWVAWSIADFMLPQGTKLYPYPQWYEAHKSPKPKIDIYRVEGILLCKPQDGLSLPFELVIPKAPEPQPLTVVEPGVPMPVEVREQISKLFTGLETASEKRVWSELGLYYPK